MRRGERILTFANFASLLRRRVSYCIVHFATFCSNRNRLVIAIVSDTAAIVAHKTPQAPKDRFSHPALDPRRRTAHAARLLLLLRGGFA